VDLSRAFSYIFEDEEWIPKLAITVALVWIGGLLTPVLVGLVAFAALAGYTVDLVRNLRDGSPRPLPRWDNYGEKISKGGSVLVAAFVYGLPNALIGCCMWLFGAVVGNQSLVGGGLNLALACCAVPLLLVFNLISWPMLALGLARYAEEGNIGVFFQFGDLFGTLQRQIGVTIQWVLLSLLVNIALGVVGAIPCLGWVAAPALALPVHGFLLGQFAGLVDDKPKRKRPYSH